MINRSMVIAGLILLTLILYPAGAFETRSGDTVVIDTPIQDDLMASGGTVTINAPVRSLTFAGGTLIVNAPIQENLIAVGGDLIVNAPVGVDVIAAGGEITITGDVEGKIIAAGGKISMNGKASNVALYGETVDMGEDSMVSGDALISTSSYTPGGSVGGTLVADQSWDGFDSSLVLNKLFSLLSTVILVMQVLMAIGMLILGLILIRLIPTPFRDVCAVIRDNVLFSLIAGIAGFIIAIVLILILLITLIGIPIAMIIGLLLMTGLILAPLLAGAALGTFIAEKTGKNLSLVAAFVTGFIILEIIFLIPILGFIIEIATISVGLGGLILTGSRMLESKV